LFPFPFLGDFRIFGLSFSWLVAPPFFDLACVLFYFISVFVVNLSIAWLLLYPRFDFSWLLLLAQSFCAPTLAWL
jgi:hypothetical protein